MSAPAILSHAEFARLTARKPAPVVTPNIGKPAAKGLILSRADFVKLTPRQKMAHYRNGGKVQ